MQRVLGDNLKGKGGDVATSSLSGQNIPVLLYFSAHWCPPCRQFTPVLAALYNEVNASGKQFEVVFVSFDRDESQFNDYYGTMPWLSVPYGSVQIREAAGQSFGVSGIPSLILINRDGGAVHKGGREDVMSSGPAAIEKWRKMLA